MDRKRGRDGDTSSNDKKGFHNIIKQEEIDRILSRSKSVSFNDLIEIRNVLRIILAAIFLNANYQLSSGVKKRAFSYKGAR